MKAKYPNPITRMTKRKTSQETDTTRVGRGRSVCTVSEHVLGQPPRKTPQPRPRKQAQRVHLRFTCTERHYAQRSSQWSRAEQTKHPSTGECKGMGLSVQLKTAQNEGEGTPLAHGNHRGEARTKLSKDSQTPKYTQCDAIQPKFTTSGTSLW